MKYKDQCDSSNSLIFSECSVIKKIPHSLKLAKGSERKTGEPRAAHEPSSAEGSSAGRGEAGSHSFGCGEGRGQPYHQETAEDGGKVTEGSESGPGI